jgi:transposase
VQGREYVCSDLSGGGNGDSLSANMDTGVWKDFASDDGGSDLVSLVAAVRGIGQGEAARTLSEMIGVPASVAPSPRRQDEKPAPVVPVPEGTPEPPSRHPRLGIASASYKYRDRQGRLLGYVCRFNKAETGSKGKPQKEFCPQVWTRQGWRWQALPEPRPLYGLDRLAPAAPEASVLVLEGEGKADAAQSILGPTVAVLSLNGGSAGVGKLDLSPLQGRKVLYWPDNDAPGRKAAQQFMERAGKAGAASVALVMPPDGMPEGWDAGDALVLRSLNKFDKFHLRRTEMGAPAKKIELTEEEAVELRMLVNAGTTEQRIAVRARVVLAAAQGMTLPEISSRVGLSVNSCLKWRKRFVQSRLDGLIDREGRGRPREISQEQRLEVMALACTTPVDGSNHWSVRKLADATGFSVGAVHGILNAGDLKPHKVRHWCGKSPDPEFAAKQAAIIGLYVDPPVNALVLCVDEKSQIQALDRTQPLLPMRSGAPKRLTATYKRNGTTCLLAAFAVHEGTIKGRCVDSTNHVNFLNFLKHLYRSNPGRELHIIADNLSAHKHKDVIEWAEKRRRLHLHFTPTYASWLNQIEIWFNIFTRDVLKGGVWRSKQALVMSIMKPDYA